MEKILDNSILVTMDVQSLYTNIPNKELKLRKQPNENYLNISPVGFNTKQFCFQQSELPTD